MLGCVYNTDSDVNHHQDQSQAWVLEGTGLGSLESPIETRRGFTVRVARKEVGPHTCPWWTGPEEPGAPSPSTLGNADDVD